MPCYLYINGKDFNVDEFVNKTCIPPEDVSRRGDTLPVPRPNGRTIKISAVQYIVSEADFNEHEKQINDALLFFRNHWQVISEHIVDAGIEFIYLDFGMDNEINREKITKTFIFPAELLKYLSVINCDLHVALYYAIDPEIEI